MAKTPDNFLSPLREKPIFDKELFIRMERSSLRHYTDSSCQALHRLGAPAVIHDNGCVEYWNNGLLHNASGPAIETLAGKQVYYLFGRRLVYRKWIELKKRYSLGTELENSVINAYEDNRKADSRD